MSDLAKLVAACPSWRWMPGMAIMGGDGPNPECRVVRVVADPATFPLARYCGADAPESDRDVLGPEDLPDLTDPATIGCLLALVRIAHNDVGIGIRRRTSGRWQVLEPGQGCRIAEGDTEAAALCAALLAVPR